MGKVKNALWGAYAGLPGRVRDKTDRIVKVTVKAARKISPGNPSTQVKGKAWVEAQKKKFFRR